MRSNLEYRSSAINAARTVAFYLYGVAFCPAIWVAFIAAFFGGTCPTPRVKQADLGSDCLVTYQTLVSERAGRGGASIRVCDRREAASCPLLTNGNS